MERRQERQTFYRHFELPVGFPVVGLLGDRWESVGIAGSPCRLHFHNCLEIGWFYKGSCTYYTTDAQYHLQAPCLFITPPNMPHMTAADEGVVCGWNWLYVDPVQMMESSAPTLRQSLGDYQRTLTMQGAVLDRESFPQEYALVEMIVQEMQQRGSRYDLAVRQLFGALFVRLMRRTTEPGSLRHSTSAQMNLLAPAMDYINENYRNDVSIDALARLCHVSTSHFRRLFKQLLGWSPLDYLQLVRVERACVLLYGNELSITEISMQVGYPSPSSFRRQFHRIYGISPGQWRKRMHSEDNPQVTAYLDSLPKDTPGFLPTEYLPSLTVD